MKLLGRDIPTEEVMARIEERLRLRGLAPQSAEPSPEAEVEPRVDPWAFWLQALEQHADATRGLPLETHRGGAGRLVLVAKWAFRKTCQVFINEALARQRVFNGHVSDGYAHLSAEVQRLKAEVETLRAAQSQPATTPAPRAKSPARSSRPSPPTKGRG